jgi:hypothetical protein
MEAILYSRLLQDLYLSRNKRVHMPDYAIVHHVIFTLVASLLFDVASCRNVALFGRPDGALLASQADGFVVQPPWWLALPGRLSRGHEDKSSFYVELTVYR